ncbi:MAG: hypothetical protein VX998_04560, partial [Candidatus Thermoplasmatota archaeon]|nr:hypothetical protein [Candidatus Thermoplasmatota archaeon]
MHPVEPQRSELRIPSTGITLLEGPGYFGKDGRLLAQHWTSILLSKGHAVHWIDGGHRFDPSRFFPAMRSLNCPIEDGLRRLYIGRGFTLHQLHALIQRVRHEVALTQASMIVVDGMLAMFLDEQIKRFEARSILRHCMASLEEVGRTCPIVLLDGKTMSPLHQQLKHTMRPYVRHRLQGTWSDREKTTLQLTSSTGVYQVTMKQPSHPIAQQQLNHFTSIVPAEQLAAQAVALPTIRTEREPTILPAQQVDGSNQHRCAEVDHPDVRIPV